MTTQCKTPVSLSDYISLANLALSLVVAFGLIPSAPPPLVETGDTYYVTNNYYPPEDTPHV